MNWGFLAASAKFLVQQRQVIKEDFALETYLGTLCFVTRYIVIWFIAIPERHPILSLTAT